MSPTHDQSQQLKDAALLGAASWFDSGAFADTLAKRVAFASSSEENSPGELLTYLVDEIAPYLEPLGFECQTFDNPLPGMPPLMVARRIESPDLPTVFTYGHGDVVRGQDAQWREGLQPWTLSAEGDRWYGRGTADNKGQHTVNFAALSHVIAARGGKLGYNITVLLEMGEEVGSPGLREFCEAHRELLASDVFIASDGPRVHAAKPTLFLGSRGIVNFTLSLNSRDRAFHSGNWGGVLTNPAVVISNAVASLVDKQGRILVKGLRPTELGDDIREALTSVEIGGDAEDPTTDATWGEPGLSEAERLMGWNAIEVLAMGSGSIERPVGAIPPKAVAYCQLRFIPRTPWERVEEIVQAHLREAGFHEVTVKVTAGTPATRLSLSNPWVKWTKRSIERSTGKTVTILPNLAGSLPNDVFAEILGLPTLWIPHSYPACAQHAPNEHLLKSVAREGLMLMTGLFYDLGEQLSQDKAPWNAKAHSVLQPTV